MTGYEPAGEKASHDSDVMGLSEVAQQWGSEEKDGEDEEDGACEEDLECNQVEEEENFVQGIWAIAAGDEHHLIDDENPVCQDHGGHDAVDAPAELNKGEPRKEKVDCE